MTISKDHLERPVNPSMPTTAWSEILPNLWQGGTIDTWAPDRWIEERLEYTGRADGRRVLKKKITPDDFDSVYTFYADAEPADWFVKEIRYPFYDTDLGNALVGNVEVELMDIVRMASRDWADGKKVLIRCQAGLNRSGLVMGLVLIRAGYTAEEALHLMRSGRSEWCVCNKSFERYLLSTDPEIWRN
jgi:hypothetical protein